MSTKDDGGPAFPAKRTEHRPIVEGGAPFPVEAHYTGLSIRDWFAGMALSGICASINNEAMANAVTAAAKAHGVHEEEFAAKQAYALADAMLAEREKRDE